MILLQLLHQPLHQNNELGGSSSSLPADWQGRNKSMSRIFHRNVSRTRSFIFRRRRTRSLIRWLVCRGAPPWPLWPISKWPPWGESLRPSRRTEASSGPAAPGPDMAPLRWDTPRRTVSYIKCNYHENNFLYPSSASLGRLQLDTEPYESPLPSQRSTLRRDSHILAEISEMDSTFTNQESVRKL